MLRPLPSFHPPLPLQIIRSRRTLPSRPRLYACSPAPSTERGFALLRSDLRRISRLLRGDLTPIFPAPPTLPRYDPEVIKSYYDSRPLAALIRASVVGVPFALWLFRVRKLDKWTRRSDIDANTARRADELRRLLVWAGPTYLKVGQAVGNRPDLVGSVYSKELQKLVDDVGGFPGGPEIVKRELGLAALEEVFDEFGEEPVASASLGQVHTGRLKGGDRVAVKVQRPSVERDAALDLYVLRRVAQWFKTRMGLRSDLKGIIDEFGTRLWEELDYIQEAGNAEKFERLYVSGNKDLYVPKMYMEHTTKRVLCMEWIDGEKAPWKPNEEAKRLIGVGVRCSLEQLLNKGWVHADPHGGNLLRMKDGRLCYLDFGMCVQVEQSVRQELIAAIVRLINRDYENLAVNFVGLGFLPPEADLEPVAPLLGKAFGDASSSSSLSDLSFNKLTGNLSELATKTPIRIPAFFTLIIRSLAILEGFALQADKEFKIVDEAYPYVVNRVLTDDSPLFQKALEGVLIDPDSERLRWDRLNSILKARSSTTSSGGSDEAISKKSDGGKLSELSDRALNLVLDYLLSTKGEFLRQALYLELTDTADAAQLAVAKRISRFTNGIVPPPREEIDTERLENAIAIAKAIRLRAPDILARYQGAGGNHADPHGRDEALLRELFETTRTVAASIAERNTRRFLRRTLDTFLGEQEPKKD